MHVYNWIQVLFGGQGSAITCSHAGSGTRRVTLVKQLIEWGLLHIRWRRGELFWWLLSCYKLQANVAADCGVVYSRIWLWSHPGSRVNFEHYQISSYLLGNRGGSMASDWSFFFWSLFHKSLSSLLPVLLDEELYQLFHVLSEATPSYFCSAGSIMWHLSFIVSWHLAAECRNQASNGMFFCRGGAILAIFRLATVL